MPDQQPFGINEQKDDWDSLQRTLNYMFKDIYSILDKIQGRNSATFEPEAITLPAGTVPTVHTHESDVQGGKIDHGDALTGLADDDHAQYLLADGSRYADSLNIGAVANHTAFSATGVQTMAGTARVYKYNWVEAAGIKAPGAKPPDAIAHGTLETPAWQFGDEAVAGNQEFVSFNMQVPPDMDRSVAPSVCVGWSADGVSPGVCEWQFEYLYTAEGEDTGAAGQATVTADEAASATADGLVITLFAGMAAPGATDICLHGKLKRLSAGATDTIADTVELHGVSFKYAVNKLGEPT